MEVRFLTEDDYGTLCKWWKWWRFPAIIREVLPENGLGGVMVSDENGREICAGFLYKTNSHVCIVEWIVSNPNVKDKALRKQSLEYLINVLMAIGKQEGYTHAFTTLKNQSLISTYESCGFLGGSTNCTEMMAEL